MTAPTVTTTAEVLNAAADLIEQRGKAVGRYGTDGGPMCVLGALRYAVFGTVVFTVAGSTPEQWRLYQSAQSRVRSSVHPVIGDWNDSHDTATVVAGLRTAADAARPDGDDL